MPNNMDTTSAMDNATSMLSDFLGTLFETNITEFNETINATTTTIITTTTTTTTTTPTTTTILTSTEYIKLSRAKALSLKFECVGSNLSEPNFPLYACTGSKVVSWIASIFLVYMILFGLFKCLFAHGILNILDLRRNGISFPKRPEFFVLIFSSLPVVVSILSRPLTYPLPPGLKFFIQGWGMAQTRLFFDLFTRTATIYHLIYWMYRTPIINIIWRVYLTSTKIYTDISAKCIALYTRLKKMAEARPSSKVKPSTKGRTSEWGYDTSNRKRRSKSIRDTTLQAGGRLTDQARQQNANSSDKVNLIAPQALFTGQPIKGSEGMPNLNNLMNPYGVVISSNQASSYIMDMGLGMNYQASNLYPLNDEDNPDEMANLLDEENDKKARTPPPTLLFCRICKRLIPGLIYLVSFFVTIPSITAFERDEVDGMALAKCTPMCRSYFNYDLVVLAIIPTGAVITAFYYASLAKTQINGEEKLTYSLRCYYVTFILFNIPLIVLMLMSIAYRWMDKPFQTMYGNGIILAMTVYHLNFALKSTVYTTGCNCLICPDACLMRFPKFSQFLVSFTTPVAVKDREALMEGMYMPVYVEETKAVSTATTTTTGTTVTTTTATNGVANATETVTK